MNGKLYGIGTGPGDPELLTLKAIRAIEECDVIAVPGSESGDRTAFRIVERYLEGKPLVECGFSMDRDEQKRKAQRAETATQICEILASGRSVGFVTLGDPSIYSTFGYLRRLVSERGFETVTIPGVPSFCGVAAVLNVSLCEGDEPLHVLPAACGADLETGPDLPGTTVIMKSGKNINAVLNALKNRGLGERTQMVARCGMEGERIFKNIDAMELAKEPGQVGYFSVLVVKGTRENVT